MTLEKKLHTRASPLRAPVVNRYYISSKLGTELVLTRFAAPRTAEGERVIHIRKRKGHASVGIVQFLGNCKGDNIVAPPEVLVVN